MVSRFVNEAKAVNQIGHEHIVDITDFGNTPDGEFYFIMEYLQGESLSDRLKRETPLRAGARAGHRRADRRRAGRLARARRSSTATSSPRTSSSCTRGGDRDFVKVLDFGLAKLTQSDEKVTHKTRTGSVMGTPYYMSPEQCEGKTEIDHRADIYSLGVLLFEMLTGKVPFGGEGYGEIIVKHVTMPPPSVRSIVPELPEYMDPILSARWPRTATSGSRPWPSCARRCSIPSATPAPRPRSASPTTCRASRAPPRRWRGREMDALAAWLDSAGSIGTGRRRAERRRRSARAGEIIDDLMPHAERGSRARAVRRARRRRGAVVASAPATRKPALPAAPVARCTRRRPCA